MAIFLNIIVINTMIMLLLGKYYLLYTLYLFLILFSKLSMIV